MNLLKKIIFYSLYRKRQTLPLEHYYKLLDKSKTTFFNATIEEIVETRQGGPDSALELLRILKATQNSRHQNSGQLTDEQKEYLKLFITRLEEGAIPIKKRPKSFAILKME